MNEARASARAPQGAALGRPDDLVLEALEKELAAAARAKRLISLGPHGSLATAHVGVCGAQLLHGRPTGSGRDDDLTEAVSAEVAIELGTKGHMSRFLHPLERKGRFFVPYRRNAHLVSASVDTCGPPRWTGRGRKRVPAPSWLLRLGARRAGRSS